MCASFGRYVLKRGTRRPDLQRRWKVFRLRSFFDGTREESRACCRVRRAVILDTSDAHEEDTFETKASHWTRRGNEDESNEGWLRSWSKRAWKRCETITSDAIRGPGKGSIVRALDDASDVICQVLDASELLRNVHPDPNLRTEAESVCRDFTHRVHALNARKDLYQALKMDLDAMRKEGCTEECEAYRVGTSLKTEFERGGVGLSQPAKRELHRLQKDEFEANAEFSRNLVDPHQLGWVDVRASMLRSYVPDNLHPSILKRSFDNGDGSLRVSTDPFALSQILKWIPQEQIRKEAFLAAINTPSRNQACLDALTVARKEQALLLGHSSYGELVLKDMLARDPSNVQEFLEALSQEIGPKAEEEHEILSYYKRRETGSSNISPWDNAYFLGMAKAESCGISASEISAYFHVENCISGLVHLSERLFGLRVKRLALDAQETWAEDVFKLEFRDDQGLNVGIMYLDLFPRPGKFSQAGHFTIRCGKTDGQDGSQSSIVALICNFQDSAMHLLTHQELETLFHEFGHGMHSILSRTKFQHLSGTRTALDFVEIPSHLFEHFVWDHNFLQEFAIHYKTGEPIGCETVERLRQARRMFHCMDTQLQLVYALFDQGMHSREPPLGDECSSFLYSLHEQHSVFKPVEGTKWHLRFNHLLGYGGAYYSYLYAKACAQQIWDSHFRQDPLSELAGKGFQQKILQWGGSRDPSILLENYLGMGVQRQDGGYQPSVSAVWS